MRKRKLMAMAVTAAMAAATLAGCGSKTAGMASVSAGKKENKVESTLMDTVGAITDGIDKAAAALEKDVTGEAAATEAPADTTEAPTQAVPDNANPVTAEAKAANEPKAKDSSSGSPKSDSSAANKPAAPENKSNSGGSGTGGSSSGNSNSNAPANPAPNPNSGKSGSGSSAPAAPKPHEHNWKEHTATRQVWVPNIVTVDDYEEKTVVAGYLECDCGARFGPYEIGPDGGDALTEHMKTSALNEAYYGIPSNCGGSMDYTYNEIQKIKIGSHEEDHGHYETEAYVDGYYCDCGATK